MSIKTLNFFKRKSHYLWLLLIVGASFFIAHPVFAETAGDWAGIVVGKIIGVFISALGLILLLVIKGLILIASYQNFIGSQAVLEGWVIVRDIANMFFVVILLIIAFSTILHIENYSYKKWLPKLILMAILINFSKTICGLMIDVAQVVMLTFVNAFKDVAGGNIIDMLGITDIVTMSRDADDAGFWVIVGAYVLGLIYMIIALVVITTMMMILAMRLVMIWIYVVLSPLAYLLSAFPAGAQYASKWWKDFTQNLIIGPVLAFFIWLSFAALQTGTDMQLVQTANEADMASETGAIGAPTGSGAFAATKASTPGALVKFVIGIGMLIGGLKIAQEIGGAAGSIAGKGMGNLNKLGAMGTGMALGASASLGLGVAKKLNLKEHLGTIAGSQGGVGKVLAATGIRGLATNTLVGLNRAQKTISDKAEKKIGDLKDTRVVARYAKEGGGITASKMAARSKAREMMPSALVDPVKIQEHLAGMSREALQKLSDPEWHRIGESGAELEGRAMTYIEKNSDERGAYNRGRNKNRRPMVVGTDRNGDPMTGEDRHGSYMRPSRNPLPQDEVDRLESKGKYKNDYRKSRKKKIEDNTTAPVDADKKGAPRGNGNLAVNDFARGKSDMVAVDFEKLNIKEIEKADGTADWSGTQGLNTSDPAMMQKIAGKMVGILDQEISKLQAKPNLSGGDQKRLENLQTAKSRFEKPEELQNMQLINSSAADYKLSDVKETVVHEQVHALGYHDEDDVNFATERIMQTREYDIRKDKQAVDDILKDKPGKARSGEIKGDSSFVELDTSRFDTSVEALTKKMADLGTKFAAPTISANSVKPGPSSQNFAYWFGLLRKAILSSGKADKAAEMLGGDEEPSPIALEVISHNLSKNLGDSVAANKQVS
ncbi:hypothetical protein CVU83_00750 [Candidatus Falkowbacteria bacterium HGW-Falkowbacteria-2]|uniref:Uncharacterized protein n=1 Tax=Candidatus Falkowbacteria bacterium HGW-Falkowbacteria-2 TaxID=2013769 RepID=A0A2N2E2V2_9BACT|nr:MAG: hypothetical protein CVU83_00750 [Candidatus Falkowbacteria bacterium HGW-Falkowbacteria-2]